MYRLIKKFTFEASHQLLNHDGKCRRLHGHSWTGRAILEGPDLILTGAKEGMLIDYGDVKEVIRPLVEDYLDHHHLNLTLENESPTSEFIAKWIYGMLKPHLPLLVAVRIDETCTSSCEYRP
jgi:6-pyruvoyltetrahydropterin/6-carboxytetrahydropterin synthase